jgi:hypothetical protein
MPVHKKAPPKRGNRRQTTAKDMKIDPFDGVVKKDALKAHMLKLRDGNDSSKSYIRGSLQYLERRPPNPFIVPVLRKTLERYG